MNILADVAAGGDRDKLRKMMEQGQVDVYKYLPLVFEEMRKRAQIGLKEYYEKTLYQQRRVERANEAFLRTFMDAGASEGMLAVYRAFAQTVEDSIPTAEWLGDAFRRAGHLMSAAIVAPKEFFDWLRGQEKEGNFMTALFGDSKDHETFQGILTELNRLKLNFGGEINKDFSMWKTTLKEIEMILKSVHSILKTINETVEGIRIFRNEGFTESLNFFGENKDVEDARKIAKAQLEKENPNYTEADLVNRTSQIFAIVQQNRKNSLIPRVLQNDLIDAPEKWMEGFTPESSPNYSPNSVVNIPTTPTSGMVEPYVRPLVVLSSPPNPVDIMNRAIENMQPAPENQPFATPYTNQITPEVRIIVSGGITVDGELGTMIDDTNLSEKFNEQIEQMLYGTRPQFSVVHR